MEACLLASLLSYIQLEKLTTLPKLTAMGTPVTSALSLLPADLNYISWVKYGAPRNVGSAEFMEGHSFNLG